MITRLEHYFMFHELGTTWRRELLAGITTFVSMSYILFLNPTILGDAGMDKGAVFTATALTSAIGCILMGIYAKYPIASAPSLGINAFFAYTVCIGMKVPWQTALSGVLIASILFALITIFKLQELIITAIPADLKSAISSGIGLFIAFIGLHQGELVVSSKSTVVELGSFNNPLIWLTIFGLIVSVVLMIRNVPGAIFIGMVLTSLLGIITKLIPLPQGIVSPAPSLAPTFGAAFTHLPKVNSIELWVVVLTFLLVTFFDTAGTLVGLAQQAGFMKNGTMPRANKALMSDALAMFSGSALGTSPVGAYVESSAGIAVGGRSGMTVIFTGLLFILGTFFSPLLTVVTSQVTAPALIIVGVLMASHLADIHWQQLEIAIPAFLIIIGMPLTYSIADGLALGMIAYPITMLAAKRGKEITPVIYILALIFIGFLWIIKG